jgi:hypothetical protein
VGDVRRVGRCLELEGETEIAGPAAGAGLDKHPHAGRFAGEGRIGLERPHSQGRAGEEAVQDYLTPAQARLLELPGQLVSAQSMPSNQTQVARPEIEDPLIPIPLRGLAVHFQGRGLEQSSPWLRSSRVSVRSRDVSPSWAGCAKELTEEVALLVRARRSTFQSASRRVLSTQRYDASLLRCFGPQRAEDFGLGAQVRGTEARNDRATNLDKRATRRQ